MLIRLNGGFENESVAELDSTCNVSGEGMSEEARREESVLFRDESEVVDDIGERT